VLIKSFNGIGDCLFATPSFRVIKEAYPNSIIHFNTNYPGLVEGNPFVDIIGTKDQGIFLGYPAPVDGILPTCHHVLSDWKVICAAYQLQTAVPSVVPEIYIPLKDVERRDVVAVTTHHKGQWHGKRVWPHFKKLSLHNGFEAIPHFESIKDLVRYLGGVRGVVCPEGGIHSICAAIGTPRLVIYGGFSDPRWVGYPGDKWILDYSYPCHHCYCNKPCEKPGGIELACLNSISIEGVLNRVEDLDDFSIDYPDVPFCFGSVANIHEAKIRGFKCEECYWRPECLGDVRHEDSNYSGGT